MNKIIITGVPRTGTTALATLLTQSKNILITNELGIFSPNKETYIKQKKSFLKEQKDNNHPYKGAYANSQFLKDKEFTEQDLDNFFAGDFTNCGDIRFFGDKFPTYCTDDIKCDHLARNHYDAYYIFTYRNPCAVINSFIKKTKVHKNEWADWFFNNLDESIQKIIDYTTNWSTKILPHVDKKIIINYDYYINNVNLLLHNISNFLNTTIIIPNVHNTKGHREIFDTSYRGLYEHPNPEDYKTNLSKKDIEYIINKTKDIDLYVKSLINELDCNK